MTTRCRPDFRVFALAIAANVTLGACVSMPTAEELRRAPSPHLAADAPDGIVDGRSGFRTRFCTTLEEQSVDPETSVPCEFWLHHLADEPTAPRAPAQQPPRSAMQVLLVSGAFSECLGEYARPFESAVVPLRGRGFRIDTIVVGGR